MLQSQLNFSASKRTSSTSGITKSKVVKPALASKVPPRSPRKLKRRTSSGDEETDDYDDIETPEISEEEVDEIKDISPPVEEKERETKTVELPLVEEVQSVTPKTRSQTKKASSSTSSSAAKKNATKVKDVSSTNASPLPFKPSNLKPEDLAKKVEANALKENDVDQVPELDPKSAKWNKEYGAAKAKMGHVPAIHGEEDNKVHEILRVFDNSHEYGPCVGMTRLERWERADALGLNPPKEIYEILNTKQGLNLDEYKHTVFHKQV
ncbi:DNA polymerase delta, subunit 4-domain-containing protein [Crepidotus variabilis]|uniref:DNA polymerase delta, subunit 4-domain-containing protein n=1 Tax=Crepidotus variabilis TaxID=179855 RepID=A0A9P6EK71_9AGAR|nr:DNA polymerase delta, subunit 4-domain-containing protein [Crepidotus variabilis]